ncbi:hypothetical protein C7B61_01310 [filamentous cyanobacterium CCP1]|nr:hypothetical protein C7B76_00475 [filamentous cyanobacterium CCP2]PSB68357.1 hypothetical protein C7B61_01310 [filamentous cyanobacterium CCP1]
MDSSAAESPIHKFRNNIWILGIFSLLFGVVDRAITIYSDNYVSAIEFLQLLIPTILLLGWLYLKPEEDWVSNGSEQLQQYREKNLSHQDKVYLSTAQARMDELQAQHKISQCYVLPFPYLCQIYHLLNLKHLENVHSFSLGNLRVVGISDVQPTAIGGTVSFQTVLDSPMNVLRIWRRPVVEVDLVLHTPYMVELSVPVYGEKRIIIIFNVLPINEAEHEFLIDIYSDLEGPKFLLQALLHFAACLTLFEDLPYLRQLANRNLLHAFRSSQSSGHQTMWLFRRFVDLYGSNRSSQHSANQLESAR